MPCFSPPIVKLANLVLETRMRGTCGGHAGDMRGDMRGTCGGHAVFSEEKNN